MKSGSLRRVLGYTYRYRWSFLISVIGFISFAAADITAVDWLRRIISYIDSDDESLNTLLAMSLMGGALIVMSAGDHKSNNSSDEYQQTFYVAETALIQGEKYILNQFLGPWDTKTNTRDLTKKNLAENQTKVYDGSMTKVNYGSRYIVSSNGLGIKCRFFLN